jgi:aryl-alcohol dehydrogenase-like predicted oxidoreductase
MSSRLALGTVQFGLAYGVSNKTGQVGREEAAAILATAWRAGVDTLDTAIAYGESEQRLGELGVADWQVISKLPPMPDGVEARQWVRQLVEGSLARLRTTALRGLLLHQPSLLLGPQGDEVHRALLSLKEAGVVEKIGVSIYSPADMEALWSRYHIDLVQAPINILDRRLLETGWLQRMHDAGTEVHARSVFLQGLLLMDARERPARFAHWDALWRAWHAWLAESDQSPLAACLGFTLLQPFIDRVVVGVDSARQMEEILAASERPARMPPDSLTSRDVDLINPSRWNLP